MLAAISVAAGSFAVASLHEISVRHERLDETYAANVVLAYDLKSEQDHQDSLAPLFVLTGDRAFVGMMAGANDRFDAILRRLSGAIPASQSKQHQRLARIAALQARLRAAERQGVILRLAGASAEVSDAYFRENAGPAVRAIRDEIQAFIDDASHTYAAERRRDEALTSNALALAWLGGALALPVMVAIGYIVQRAIARRRARDAAAARLAEREREVSAARKAAVEVVAHDLRNPLAAILFSAEDLLDDPRIGAAPDLRQRVRTLSDAAGAMNRLIHNVLDETRIEAGALTLKRRPTDLTELVERVRAQFAGAAARKGIELCARSDAGVCARIDPDRIEQVLCNLAANALKFTPSGGKVSISAALEEDRLVLRVTDTGFGIAAEDLPRIFDRYWQDTHGARQGAGLGLSICRAIVQAHAGAIHVASTLDAGSTFTVTVPA